MGVEEAEKCATCHPAKPYPFGHDLSKGTHYLLDPTCYWSQRFELEKERRITVEGLKSELTTLKEALNRALSDSSIAESARLQAVERGERMAAAWRRMICTMHTEADADEECGYLICHEARTALEGWETQ